MPDTRFLGNDYLSSDNQRAYYEIKEEMRHRPELAKILLADPPSDRTLLEVIAILTFILVKKSEEAQHDRD
jgi:hypothetical protein